MQMHEHRHSISVKMAAPLETCTTEEQRSVIRFLRSEGVKPIEIHRRMKVQYGDVCLSQQQVYERSRKFSVGGKKFRSDEEVRHAVHEWLRRLPKEFFSKEICALCKRWGTCIEHGGDMLKSDTALYHFCTINSI